MDSRREQIKDKNNVPRGLMMVEKEFEEHPLLLLLLLNTQMFHNISHGIHPCSVPHHPLDSAPTQQIEGGPQKPE